MRVSGCTGFEVLGLGLLVVFRGWGLGFGFGGLRVWVLGSLLVLGLFGV